MFIQSVSGNFRYRSQHSTFLCTCWKKTKVAMKRACSAVSAPFFWIFKTPHAKSPATLLCRVAGIDAQSETGVYQHGEHSQLSFTSLSPQAKSKLNTYMHTCHLTLKTCQLTGNHRPFNVPQLNPFFQAHLYFTNLTRSICFYHPTSLQAPSMKNHGNLNTEPTFNRHFLVPR